MASALLTKQFEFTLAVADLIYKAKQLGYLAKLVDVYRDPEWQKVLVRRGASKTTNSRHNINLAADLYLFTCEGKMLESYEDYKKLGEWWEKLGEDYVWGGSWPKLRDLVHFEVKP